VAFDRQRLSRFANPTENRLIGWMLGALPSRAADMRQAGGARRVRSPPRLMTLRADR
jgi:hypothetical protein